MQTKPVAVIGIDVGAEGAMALIHDGTLHKVLRFSTCALPEVCSDLRLANQLFNLTVYVEKVGSMPKQGVASSFSFGQRYGEIIGVLTALEVPYRLVLPTTWQKGLCVPTVKAVGKTKHKQALKAVAKQRYPYFKGANGKDMTNDEPDAILIADYGWMTLPRG